MFSNPVQPSASVDEGTVVQVDAARYLCKVKTFSGQILHSVQWLLPVGGSNRGSDRFSPAMGDRVMLNFQLGYPVIIGFLPRYQDAAGSFPMEIFSDEELDTGSYSPASNIRPDQNRPLDMISGDRIISSTGGGLLGILRSGMVILRSTRAAEIALSNFQGLVRIISRNWEHFTDVSSDVVRNFKGKVYRFIGYTNNFTQSKAEQYKLNFYYGDVTTAEAVKTGYHTSSANPLTGTLIYKEQVKDNVTTTPRELMRRTLNEAGEEEIYITNGTHHTRITSTAEQIQITWNNQNIVTINEAHIHAVHKDGADYIMDSAGIRATFSSGTINMEATKVTTSFGSSSAVLTNSDITVTNGNGTAFVSNSQTRISNSGHQVLVNSGGVAIS